MKIVRQQKTFKKKDGTSFTAWVFYIQLTSGFLIQIKPNRWSYVDKNGVTVYKDNVQELMTISEVIS